MKKYQVWEVVGKIQQVRDFIRNEIDDTPEDFKNELLKAEKKLDKIEDAIENVYLQWVSLTK